MKSWTFYEISKTNLRLIVYCEVIQESGNVVSESLLIL
jgi:hypothetical protein